MRHGGSCKCGKAPLGLSLVSEGVCHWCGRGYPLAPALVGRAPRLRRLPLDLGAFQREGRRPDPRLDYVVRLDRLRDGWKVPALRPVDPVRLTPAQIEALELVGAGLKGREIAERLGISQDAANKRIRDACLRLGTDRRKQAVEWWRDQQEAARCGLVGAA